MLYRHLAAASWRQRQTQPCSTCNCQADAPHLDQRSNLVIAALHTWANGLCQELCARMGHASWKGQHVIALEAAATQMQRKCGSRNWEDILPLMVHPAQRQLPRCAPLLVCNGLQLFYQLVVLQEPVAVTQLTGNGADLRLRLAPTAAHI